MTTQTLTSDMTSMFTAAQRQALYALRDRYLQERDLFSTRELARLRFLRWLHDRGRLAP
jgi:hypothetical protein